LVGSGEKSGVAGRHARDHAEPLLMLFNRRTSKAKSAGRRSYTWKATTIWFSASWTLSILPNSVGLPGFPWRMISVVCANRLTILPAESVMPWMIPGARLAHHLLHAGKHRVDFFFMPSRAACGHTSAERLTPWTISCEKRLAEPPLVRSSPTVCDSPAPAFSALAVHARGWPVPSQ
jgi:hypothetical protein